MTFAELMRFLLDNDVQISTDGRSLHYDAPEGVPTERVLGELRRHKPTLISWLGAGTSGAGTSDDVASGGGTGYGAAAPSDPAAAPVRRTLPTYIQEVYWHRVRSHPRPAVYTIAQRLRFTGRLDVAALRTALDRLVARHDPLRTRFSSYRTGDGDQPVQEIVARLPARLVVTDLTALPERRRPAELERRCAEQVGQPFALDRAPLWRAQLFVCAADRHVLLWTLQHIICDGWSLATLTDELVRGYAAVVSGRPDGSGDAPAPLGYPEYARWQRRQLAGPERERLAAFWRAELAGASLALPLPLDRPAPRQPSGRGAAYHFTVDPAVVTRLRATAGALHSTPYLVVLSAFARLLGELTGQDDLVIPISHANRTRGEHERVVGLLSDRVPVRIRLGGVPGGDVADGGVAGGGVADGGIAGGGVAGGGVGDGGVAGFGELVRRVGRAVFAALDHGAMPLSLLLAALPERQRPAGYYPTVLFTLLDAPAQRWDLGELTVTAEPDSAQGGARMQLYCFLTVSGDRLSGAIEYPTELFDAATVVAWAERFVALLAEAGRLGAEATTH